MFLLAEARKALEVTLWRYDSSLTGCGFPKSLVTRFYDGIIMVEVVELEGKIISIILIIGDKLT